MGIKNLNWEARNFKEILKSWIEMSIQEGGGEEVQVSAVENSMNER